MTWGTRFIALKKKMTQRLKNEAELVRGQVLVKVLACWRTEFRLGKFRSQRGLNHAVVSKDLQRFVHVPSTAVLFKMQPRCSTGAQGGTLDAAEVCRLLAVVRVTAGRMAYSGGFSTSRHMT